ncbi:lysM domain-containing protein [Hirsutella rhossiliensis]|uniref:LysM domain-containing protein n=1 Tax=Hirsutella rhossiliensis TaxID=111463 RepID=A0A9P8SDN0_9HYPO|nr:lysM domain-containing protein [Hirsutella rhossiliensis]KAH0958129.1 lysM domain-containing protein [Hirsutella rhossiliensis]
MRCFAQLSLFFALAAPAVAVAEQHEACQDVPASFGISEDKWKRWNPSIAKSCDNFAIDRSYCVEAEAEPVTTTTASATSTTTTDSPSTTTAAKPDNGISTPTPIQPGMVDNCNKFYLVKSGNTCQSIAQGSGITLKEFMAWNPDVGATCTSLWLHAHVCVSISGYTPSPTNPGNGIETPTPIQPGMPGIVKPCDRLYQAISGDTCQGIVDKHRGLSLDNSYKWNPAVHRDCTGLLAGYYYCVSVPKAFQLETRYHAGCTGDVHNRVTVENGSDGLCIDTQCAAASTNMAVAGSCPDGQVQLSYWEKPGCSGKWFGYGYTSRGHLQE